jgi:hypothetical protein
VRVIAIPGAWVQLWALESGGVTPISNQVFATSNSIRIAVSPYLHEGQEVWLSYLLCGAGSWAESRHHIVGPTPDVGPAYFTLPLVEGDTSVIVDAIPGAAVDVYAITGMPIKVEHIGSGVVDPLVKSVGLTRPLTQRDLVYAEQRICSGRPGVGAAKTVLPAVRHFTLGMPLKRLSHQNDAKPLVCTSAQIILRHNGWWEFTASLENQETGADCSFDLQFALTGVSSPFGAVIPGDLSAKDSSTGSAILGVPSSQTFPRTDFFAGFTNSLYWEEILGATYKFDLIVAWQALPPDPEADDAEED